MDISKLTKEQKAKVAVAYLVQIPEVAPDNIKKYIDKLRNQESVMRNIMNAAEQAKRSLKDLSKQASTVSGGIAAITDLASSELPENMIDEWASKFEIEPALQQQIENDLMQAVPAEQPVDMAGKTAKVLGPISIKR